MNLDKVAQKHVTYYLHRGMMNSVWFGIMVLVIAVQAALAGNVILALMSGLCFILTSKDAVELHNLKKISKEQEKGR